MKNHIKNHVFWSIYITEETGGSRLNNEKRAATDSLFTTCEHAQNKRGIRVGSGERKSRTYVLPYYQVSDQSSLRKHLQTLSLKTFSSVLLIR